MRKKVIMNKLEKHRVSVNDGTPPRQNSTPSGLTGKTQVIQQILMNFSRLLYE
jgi:hypothetical protein